MVTQRKLSSLAAILLVNALITLLANLKLIYVLGFLVNKTSCGAVIENASLR